MRSCRSIASSSSRRRRACAAGVRGRPAVPAGASSRASEISGRQVEIADAIVRRGRVGVDRSADRKPGPSQPAELAVALLDEPRHVVFQLGPHRDERRQRIAPAAEPRQHGADVRPVARAGLPSGGGGWPVSRKCVAVVWSTSVCVIERTIASLSVRWASCGKCSQIWMPGTLVRNRLELAADFGRRSGLQSPRYPAGPARPT